MEPILDEVGDDKLGHGLSTLVQCAVPKCQYVAG